MRKPEWPAYIADQLGIPPVMGIGGAWQSSEGTTNVAWFRSICDLFGIAYPGNRVAAMRALVEMVGVEWDDATMSSTGTTSGGGGNVRKGAYEAFWGGLVAGKLVPNQVDDPAMYSDDWHPDTAQALPEITTVVRNIRLRQGQPAFRARLLEAYEGRCAITEWDIAESLEAAHIKSHSNGGDMNLSNGLLLRADIHTLFDLGLLAVDTGSWTVVASDSVLGTESGGWLHGHALRLPVSITDRPRKEWLDEHRANSGL